MPEQPSLLLSSLHGGLVLFSGQPWWIVLPRDRGVAEPKLFAHALLEEVETSPEQAAVWLGARRAFPLDKARRGTWKKELRRARKSDTLLPNIERLQQGSHRLPCSVPAPFQAEALRVWRRLVPLFGLDIARAVLDFALLAWKPWQESKAYHPPAFQNLRAMIDANPDFLEEEFSAWSPRQRAEFFSHWMGRGRGTLEALEAAADGKDMSTLHAMRAVWCGDEEHPSPDVIATYMALGLAWPGVVAPEHLSWPSAVSLLSHCESANRERFQRMVSTIESSGARAWVLSSTSLSADDLQFAKDHGLSRLLTQQYEPGQARPYLRLCRALLKAGFSSRLLDSEALVARSGRREAFAYLLMLELEEPPSLDQLRLLDEIAPSGRFQASMPPLPELTAEVSKEIGLLSRWLDLSPQRLQSCARHRLGLGLSPFTKRIEAWTSAKLGSEQKHLLTAVMAQPENSSLRQRLTRLRERQPNEKERRHAAEELERAGDDMPRRRWEAAKAAIGERLLDALLGQETARSAPRAGLFLKHTEVPLSRLAEIRQNHEENDRWLRLLERNGFSASHWLVGWTAELDVGGRYIELSTALDPGDILEMGTHFDTCLSLDSGFNAFSVLTNILEVNKMVLLGRDAEGKVMIRKLLGLTSHGELVGYHTYSHLSGAREPVHLACRAFAEREGYKLCDHAEPERILKDLDWYDDGAESWLGGVAFEAPSDWPPGSAAGRQWITQRLAQGEIESDWLPGREVEFYHVLSHGRAPHRGVPQRDSDWQAALRWLALEGRYDLLSEPRLVGNPPAVSDILEFYGAGSAQGVTDLAKLIDPQHRLFRRTDSYFQYTALPSSLILLDPLELRRLCERCLGWLEEGPLLESLVSIVGWSYLRQPEHGAWLSFKSERLADLMVRVATLTPMPCWRQALASLSAQNPDWDEVWLARALIDGPRLLEKLMVLLDEDRESLTLALAVHYAGGSPENYRWGHPESLSDEGYINASRPLANLLLPRLARLKSQGVDPTTLDRVLSLWEPLRTENWTTWSAEVRDRDLDRALSERLFARGDTEDLAAWVALGDPSSRMEVCRLLDWELPWSYRDRRYLAKRLVYQRATTRMTLNLLWLGACPSDDDEIGQTPKGVLLWRHHRTLMTSYLFSLDLSKRFELVKAGAEYLADDELQSLVEQCFKVIEIPGEQASAWLSDDTLPVVLQIALMPFLTLDSLDPQVLATTQRGRWAAQRLAIEPS